MKSPYVAGVLLRLVDQMSGNEFDQIDYFKKKEEAAKLHQDITNAYGHGSSFLVDLKPKKRRKSKKKVDSEPVV